MSLCARCFQKPLQRSIIENTCLCIRTSVVVFSSSIKTLLVDQFSARAYPNFSLLSGGCQYFVFIHYSRLFPHL